jgi:diguanylate cyclase (GGDEF)-like protein
MAGAGIKLAGRGSLRERWQAENEEAQARLRVSGGLVACVAFGVLHGWGGIGPLSLILPLVVAYVLGSLAWWGVVRLAWGNLTRRLLAASVLEQGLYAYALGVCGEQAALIVGAPMFAALGYGLRYGPGMALFNVLLALGFLPVAFHASPYWSGMQALCVGLSLATASVPVYGAILNRRLQGKRREAERRAAAWEAASKTDPLTGLANRLVLMDALERVFDTQRQLAKVCALFYVDLDGFKAVNDEAGHAAGDQVLADVAMALSDAVRTDDLVARLGGDEFCILTYGLAAPQDAQVVADKVLQALSRITVPGHANLRIGCSIGACLLPGEGIASPQDAVRVADELMLSIKREGKGAVRIHPGVPCKRERA